MSIDVKEDEKSLRDHFAAKAMQALLFRYDVAVLHEDEGLEETMAEWLADDAYRMADRMLERRKL